MLFQEADEMFAGNSTVLRTGNSIAAKPTRIEPFANGSWGNFTDLGDLSSREDCPHYGLSNHTYATLQQTIRCKGSPRCRWSAVRAYVSMAMSTGHDFGVLSGSGSITRWCCLTRVLSVGIRKPAFFSQRNNLRTWARTIFRPSIMELASNLDRSTDRQNRSLLSRRREVRSGPDFANPSASPRRRIPSVTVVLVSYGVSR